MHSVAPNEAARRLVFTLTRCGSLRRRLTFSSKLMDQLLADTGSGHNISHSIFVECGSMYRAEGPAEMKPVGEIEFVNGAAAMNASGRYGKSRLCAGIVGHADLRLGDGVARVLEDKSPPVTAASAAFAIRWSGTP